MVRPRAGPAAVVLVAVVAAVATVVFWPRGPTYEPVRRATALDAWTGDGALPVVAADAGDPIPRRWLVVGWDGGDWNLILPLVEQGRMPNLARLMAEGAYGDLATFEPSFSPVLWTTVATGKSPAEHGILAWGREERGGEGRVRRLFSNADRRVRALWNVLSDRGRPVIVVGYHNTFPVEPVDGVMVSNFLYHEHLRDRIGGAIGENEDLSRIVDPPQLGDEVARVQREVLASLPNEIGRFVDYRTDERERFESLSASRLGERGDDRVYFLHKAFLFDTFHAALAERFLHDLDADLTMVHFQGIDLASHYFLYYHRPEWFEEFDWTSEERAVLDRDARHYRRTLTAFHEYLDRWLGRLIDAAPDDLGFMVLSDHGFQPEPVSSRTGYHDDAPPGILVVGGRGIRHGRVEGATLYDITPTLAAALGLPRALDLRGRVLRDLFRDRSWDPAGEGTVATYTPEVDYRPDVRDPIGPQDEDHVLEQLRSLGYVQ